MDIGPVIRPVQSPSATAPRAEPMPVSGAVTTDLPAAQSVPSIGESQSARLEISPQARTLQETEAAMSERVKRQLDIDTSANSVVFRSTDLRNGAILQQVPDEALLKIRAYVRSLETKDRSGPELVEKIA
jgi:hypothetical protein